MRRSRSLVTSAIAALSTVGLLGVGAGSAAAAPDVAITATHTITWDRYSLMIGDPAVRASGGAYRVLLFVNGWNMGQYIANVGPQLTFIIPNGILNPRGTTPLALAVTSNGGAADVLERVALTHLGTVRGGVPLSLVSSPGF